MPTAYICNNGDWRLTTLFVARSPCMHRLWTPRACPESDVKPKRNFCVSSDQHIGSVDRRRARLASIRFGSLRLQGRYRPSGVAKAAEEQDRRANGLVFDIGTIPWQSNLQLRWDRQERLRCSEGLRYEVWQKASIEVDYWKIR